MVIYVINSTFKGMSTINFNIIPLNLFYNPSTSELYVTLDNDIEILDTKEICHTFGL
jgi:hypothetical protein